MYQPQCRLSEFYLPHCHTGTEREFMLMAEELKSDFHHPEEHFLVCTGGKITEF
jgi:hypothetical protein